MPESPYVYESGEAIDVGQHGRTDYLFHSGDPVPNTGVSSLVFETGSGLGGLVDEITITDSDVQGGTGPWYFFDGDDLPAGDYKLSIVDTQKGYSVWDIATGDEDIECELQTEVGDLDTIHMTDSKVQSGQGPFWFESGKDYGAGVYSIEVSTNTKGFSAWGIATDEGDIICTGGADTDKYWKYSPCSDFDVLWNDGGSALQTTRFFYDKSLSRHASTGSGTFSHDSGKIGLEQEFDVNFGDNQMDADFTLVGEKASKMWWYSPCARFDVVSGGAYKAFTEFFTSKTLDRHNSTAEGTFTHPGGKIGLEQWPDDPLSDNQYHATFRLETI